jgi:tetratricopeptide (TPR) repeat protein
VKPAAKNTSPAATENSRHSICSAGLLLIVATLVAYSSSFNGPFIFDDIGTILENPTIQKLWPPRDALVGLSGGTTSSGRPVVNLSLALNYALGGFDVRGYHVFNLAIHLTAGLILFGVLRRTLLRDPLRGRFGSVALPIAFASAALWLLHPLQTAAVTYVVQRAESLASLFYLLTLYGFIRASDSPKPGRWQAFSVASCLFGMASKEIVVSAPLFVLLYDRTLVSGSFSAAWRQRHGYYLALASTWLLLAALVISTQGRGGSVGSDEAITSWTYALTQGKAIVHYLRLTVWPTPLIFDYGTATVGSLTLVWPQVLLLVALVGATGYAIWKRSPLGLAGAWFFAILAPSSSVVPVITQTMAEHRMYLALASVIVLVIGITVNSVGPRCLWVFIGVAALFGGFTFHRNGDYRTNIAIWRDTTEKLPDSKRAHNNLGSALFLDGDKPGAITEFKYALSLDPCYVNAWVNLGRVQLQTDALTDATVSFQNALALEPLNADAHYGLGFVLASNRRLPEAIAHYREAVRLQPTSTDFRLKLAQTLFRVGDIAGSVEQFRETIRYAPKLSTAHTGIGTVLASQGQFAEAERELNEALRLDPNDLDAHYNLGNALIEQDRVAKAVPHYEQVLRLNPNHTGARDILERARVYLKSSH